MVGVEREEPDARSLAVTHVGAHVDLGQRRETGQRGRAAQCDVRHPERNDTDPRHAFEEVDGGGTRVLDRIEYAVVGGALIHRLFVRRDLDRIFTYRAERLREIMAPAT